MRKIAYLITLFYLFGCVENQEEEETKKPDIKADELYDQVSCALTKIYSEPTLSPKRKRTLNFIVDKLLTNFQTYKISSKIEKSHFLSQLIHESDGLTATVERSIGDTWRSLLNDPADEWNCPAYLEAVNEDDDFFNSRYIYSKNSYKSKFRGRGLIQLTGCYNYLGFFYHTSALDNDNSQLAQAHKTYFPYKDSEGDLVQAGMYCTDNDLESLRDTFLSAGLDFNPDSIAFQFEETTDELALPCNGRGEKDFNSLRFIVDSSFWYWKKCQNQDYFSSFTTKNSDQAVARISECVHGKHQTYQNYEQIDCQSSNSDDWRKRSYCSRRKAFNDLVSCL